MLEASTMRCTFLQASEKSPNDLLKAAFMYSIHFLIQWCHALSRGLLIEKIILWLQPVCTKWLEIAIKINQPQKFCLVDQDRGTSDVAWVMSSSTLPEEHAMGTVLLFGRV